jgi:hypothetical protein
MNDNETRADGRDERGRWLAGAASPNPKGRPQGRSLGQLFRDALGRERGDSTVGEQLVDVVVEMALTGNLKAAEIVFDRIEGRATTKVQEVLGEDVERAELTPNQLVLLMDKLTVGQDVKPVPANHAINTPRAEADSACEVKRDVV